MTRWLQMGALMSMGTKSPRTIRSPQTILVPQANASAPKVVLGAKPPVSHGVPLSALEIRDEVWKDGGQSVVLVEGPGRKVLPPAKEGQAERRCTTYRWCSWETSTNAFTSYPAPMASTLVMLDDPIFRAGTWYRDGKPHWAYQTPYLVKTTQRDWIEWTPNVIASKVTVEGERASVALRSFTPNFKTYQMRAGDEEWKDCEDTLALALEKRLNRFAFRAVSLFGVTGPVHRVEIDWQAP